MAELGERPGADRPRHLERPRGDLRALGETSLEHEGLGERREHARPIRARVGRSHLDGRAEGRQRGLDVARRPPVAAEPFVQEGKLHPPDVGGATRRARPQERRSGPDACVDGERGQGRCAPEGADHEGGLCRPRQEPCPVDPEVMRCAPRAPGARADTAGGHGFGFARRGGLLPVQGPPGSARPGLHRGTAHPRPDPERCRPRAPVVAVQLDRPQVVLQRRPARVEKLRRLAGRDMRVSRLGEEHGAFPVPGDLRRRPVNGCGQHGVNRLPTRRIEGRLERLGVDGLGDHHAVSMLDREAALERLVEAGAGETPLARVEAKERVDRQGPAERRENAEAAHGGPAQDGQPRLQDLIEGIRRGGEREHSAARPAAVRR